MPTQTIITEQPTWVDAVYLLEVSDLLQGYDQETGDTGVSNLQWQQLANRTAYLKQQFLVGHTAEGKHLLRNVDFKDEAGIEEVKLDLAYPTAELNSQIQSDKNSIASTTDRVGSISGISGSVISSLTKAIPLSWEYSDHGFEFELFSGDLVLRDFEDVTVLSTVSGDESIDVVDSSNLEVGRSYIIHDGSGQYPELVTVKQILTNRRVLCEQLLSRTRTVGVISCTSWAINANGTATAKNGGVYISKPIDVGVNSDNTRLIIRRTANAGSLVVKTRDVGSTVWVDQQLTSTAQRSEGTVDDEYTCPGGVFSFKVEAVLDNGSLTTIIHHMCLLPKAVLMFSEDIRKPVNTSPQNNSTNTGDAPTLTGSRYLSLYGVAQKSAQFQVASSETFSTIVYSTTKTGSITTAAVPAGILALNRAYYWRVRYIDIDDSVSKWSDPTVFSTQTSFSYIVTPINIAPANMFEKVSIDDLMLVGTAFTAKNATDVLSASQWQIATDVGFTSTVYDSGTVAGQATYKTIPNGTIDSHTKYFWRYRYQGETLGWSDWSLPTYFTTGAYIFVENVFSSALYSGTGTSLEVNNNINLHQYGGMGIVKVRNNTGAARAFDTVQGASKSLSLGAIDMAATNNPIAAFDTNGFTLAAVTNDFNMSGRTYASWVFRKATKFFDVVQYSGTGEVRAISHNLGAAPAMIMVKAVNAAGEYFIYHRSIGKNAGIEAVSGALTGNVNFWGSTVPTSASFTVGGGSSNQIGVDYVAYLFAHDPGADGVIVGGTFNCTGVNTEVQIGWKPQFVFLRKLESSNEGTTHIVDSARGFDESPSVTSAIDPFTQGMEYVENNALQTTGVGFQANLEAGDWVYVAIRSVAAVYSTPGDTTFGGNIVV